MKEVKIIMSFLVDPTTALGKKFLDDVTDKGTKDFKDEYEDGCPQDGITPLKFNYELIDK